MNLLSFRDSSPHGFRAGVLAAAGAIAVLSACSSAPPSRSVAEAPVPAAVAPVPHTQRGYVRSIETVAADSRPGRSGAVLGAVLGAVVGNQIGDGNGQKAAIAAGAVGGAVIGNQVQNRNRRDDEVYRVTVHFDDGRESNYDFQRVDDLRVGDRVKYEAGQLHRM